MGVTGVRVRLCYITCNFFIKCFTFFWYEIGSNELYCCNDSSMFRSFRCRVLLQWQCNSETHLFNCCSDSFVWKLTNCFDSSILLVFRFEEKITFFFQFIGMLTLWLDDRWLVHMDTQVSDGVAIDGLVNGVSLVFTMLRTYTSSKSGLSARKSESNSGDATISLRMVNKDTSRTCITLLCTFTH
jgi:hypothetical protein